MKNEKTVCKGGKLELGRDVNLLSKSMVGVASEDVFALLLRQTVDSLPNMLDKDGAVNAVLRMLEDAAPEDSLEAMLVTQMIATHAHAMEWSRRAALPEQTERGIEMNVSRATRLMRTFTLQVEALQKYRKKGQQTIQVQHVHVESGAQAIVGDVKGGGG